MAEGGPGGLPGQRAPPDLRLVRAYAAAGAQDPPLHKIDHDVLADFWRVVAAEVVLRGTCEWTGSELANLAVGFEVSGTGEAAWQTIVRTSVRGSADLEPTEMAEIAVSVARSGVRAPDLFHAVASQLATSRRSRPSCCGRKWRLRDFDPSLLTRVAWSLAATGCCMPADFRGLASVLTDRVGGTVVRNDGSSYKNFVSDHR